MRQHTVEPPSYTNVILQGLDIVCIIGALPQERITEQTIELDLEMAPTRLQCMQTDALTDAIDYTAVAATCIDTARRGRYHLLEALAYAISRALLEEYPILWVRLKVRKPRPLPHVAASAVELLLHRKDLHG